MQDAKIATGSRPRQSEKLTSTEMKAFEKMVKSFPTKTDATEFFGFSRVTLRNVLIGGSGKPSTISIIRSKIGTAA